eukprot:TRINITY_DN1117_c0_g1_i1.p1 TRINITY_DN1117_c0_g1~~TRINITY_DN1117_c0_g1_i1.p1  ORF type:complete len:437 (-),score=187.36 TRINITY_DN1117_c0_g1_i1:231-1541(-)
MEQILNQIVSKSGNDNDLKLLRQFLSKNQQLIASAASQIDSALGMLDASQHTLGYTFLLWVKARGSFKDEALFLRQVSLLFATGNTHQISFVSEHYVTIADVVRKLYHKRKDHLASLRLLRTAVRTLQPDRAHITPVHALLFQNALLARCYHVPVALLDEMPTDIDPHGTNMAVTDYLLFCYYGAIAYIGVKRFSAALQLLQLAMTTPAMALSAIVYECHKKFVLVSLIADGKVRSLPKQASTIVSRTLKMVAHPAYSSLVTAYSTQSTDELHKVAEKYAEEFQKDHNFGLVKQVIQSLYERNILGTTKVYLTLSLADIKESASLTSEKEVEDRIVRMISEDKLSASINQTQSTVSFEADDETYNTVEMVQQLERHLANAMTMHAKATALDEQLITSPAYIRRKLQEGDARGWVAGADFDTDADTERAIAESMARQ